MFRRLSLIDRYVLVLFILLLPLFFYHLGSYSLVDFDEAWFAEVAINILRHKNPLVLTFNSEVFNEHPPFGFVLMALSMTILGPTEFAVRFFAALCGLFSVVTLYFIGKRLWNPSIGISAASVLVSCVWFIFRSRSGNLDTIFLFLYLLSFYLALYIGKGKHAIYYMAIASALLFLTKILVGASVFLPIMIYLIIHQVRVPKKDILKACILFFAIVLPWIIANVNEYGVSFLSHIWYVGFRPFGRITPNWGDLLESTTFQYLHFGMRKWYYLALISFGGSIFFARTYRQLIPIYAILVFFLYNFLTNAKTEIWHLIPLYSFFALLISFFFNQLATAALTIALNSRKWAHKLAPFLTAMCFVLLSLWQIYSFRNEIRLFDRDTSGLAYTASFCKSYEEPLYLYADYFLPSAVFYSGKPVQMVTGQPSPQNTLLGFVSGGPRPFLLIGESWKFELDKIDPASYELITEYKEYRLVRVR